VRWVHRSRGSLITAVVVFVVGLPLLPLLIWLTKPGGYPYVRWPGEDGARTLHGWAMLGVLLLFVAVVFAVRLWYLTEKYGPDGVVKRRVASFAWFGATVVLVLDLLFLLYYATQLSYLANPD
jgi:hypothetical protein